MQKATPKVAKKKSVRQRQAREFPLEFQRLQHLALELKNIQLRILQELRKKELTE